MRYNKYMRRNGFMMAEVVITTTVVLIALTSLYGSYVKLYSIYQKRVGYYDTVSLYRVGFYRDILIDNNIMNKSIKELDNKDLVVVYDQNEKNKGNSQLINIPNGSIDYEYNDVAILIKKDYLNSNKFDDTNYNETFKDYVKYLKNKFNYESNYVMLLERCKVNNNNICNYSYLEIYDGKE